MNDKILKHHKNVLKDFNNKFSSIEKSHRERIKKLNKETITPKKSVKLKLSEMILDRLRQEREMLQERIKDIKKVRELIGKGEAVK